MLSLITTKNKDDTLQWLCANVRPGQTVDYDLQALQETVGVDENTMNAILGHFAEKGLVDIPNQPRVGTIIELKVAAHTFLQRGGFVIEDALNEANIQKILLELDALQRQLKPNQIEEINKIASIAASIATVLTVFSGKN